MKTLESLVDWEHVSKKEELDEGFVRKYIDFVHLDKLCENKKIILSLAFIQEHEKDIDFNTLCLHQKLAEDVVDVYFDRFNVHWLISRNNLSEKNAKKYFKALQSENCLESLLLHKKMSMSFLEEFFKELPKREMSEYQRLTKSFLKKHVPELNWNSLHRNKLIKKEWLKELRKYK